MNRLNFGKAGENFATAYLLAKGYQILCQNWRYKNLEVDIVALDGEFLVFVEVKTRKREDAASADITITSTKQERLIRAAEHYLSIHNLQNEIRFDVVLIVGNGPENFRAVLLKEAFR